MYVRAKKQKKRKENTNGIPLVYKVTLLNLIIDVRWWEHRTTTTSTYRGHDVAKEAADITDDRNQSRIVNC